MKNLPKQTKSLKQESEQATTRMKKTLELTKVNSVPLFLLIALKMLSPSLEKLEKTKLIQPNRHRGNKFHQKSLR